MTEDKALKLALKALRFARDDGYENEVSQDAITAIKQALAAPVQEPVANASAWFALVMNAAAELEDASHCLRDEDAKRVAISGAKHYRDAAKALYTTPPAQEFVCSTGLCHYKEQRQWVGLSEEEIDKLKHLIDWTATWSHGRFAYEIEQLLKEKNA
jgi:hypothetical protein